MGVNWGDLDPRLRQRIIEQDPVLKAQQESSMVVLKEAIERTELFIEQYGDSPELRATLENSRALLAGDITPEEFQERSLKK